MDEATALKVKELETSKASLIGHYLELQDQADELNGKIFHLCCEIETLNSQIAVLKNGFPVNGTAAPSPVDVPKPATA